MVSKFSSVHPQYSEMLVDWILMRDAYRGERVVKNKGSLYLFPTASQAQDGWNQGSTKSGQIAYDAYKQRARFPNYVREAVQMAIGMMHSQPSMIKVPEAMMNIMSSKGEPLEVLLRRINLEQLIMGRLGLMADLPTDPSPDRDQPYLVTYPVERVVNWDDGEVEGLVPQVLNLVILDETEFERRNDFDWIQQEKYRILIIGEIRENESEATYKQGIVTNSGAFDLSQLSAPIWKGRVLNKIPFLIINGCDLTTDVDEPPLLDLGRMCMTIYRGDADYRQNLFMQGQDTLVTIGGNFDADDTIRTGAGARLDLPMGGEAKYIGVTSQGLKEQRESLSRLESRASSMGAQTLDTTSRERESGDSLRIRIAARTADMNQIVETGAAGLEHILKICAEWMGENPDEVSVKPNKDFGEMPLTGQTMVEMTTARNAGFPMSAKTMHNLARKRRMTDMTYDEEVAAAELEKDSIFKPADTADAAGAFQQPGKPSEGD